jgi:hypothetical protein
MWDDFAGCDVILCDVIKWRHIYRPMRWHHQIWHHRVVFYRQLYLEQFFTTIGDANRCITNQISCNMKNNKLPLKIVPCNIKCLSAFDIITKKVNCIDILNLNEAKKRLVKTICITVLLKWSIRWRQTIKYNSIQWHTLPYDDVIRDICLKRTIIFHMIFRI